MKFALLTLLLMLALSPAHAAKKRPKVESKAALFEQWRKRGEAREAEGDINGALSAYDAALRHMPDGALAAHVDATKKERAARYRHQSDDIYRQALLASQQGDDARAMELCRDALALDPGNIQAKRMLDRLLKRRR